MNSLLDPPLSAALGAAAVTARPVAQPDELGAVSPELILVSPPEIRQRALAELPPVPDALAAPRLAAVARDSPADAAPADNGTSRFGRSRSLQRLRPLPVLLAVGACGFFLGSHWTNDVRPTTLAVEATSALDTSAVGGAASASNGRHDTGTSVTRAARPQATKPLAPKPVAVAHPTSRQPTTTIGEATRVVSRKTKAPAVVRNKPKPRTQTPAPRSENPKPTAPPSALSGFVPAREWSWAAQPGASAYEVTFFSGGRVVLRARPKLPHLVLPLSFRFHAGSYRWTVRPVPPAPSGAPLVDSSFVLTPAAAAAGNAG